MNPVEKMKKRLKQSLEKAARPTYRGLRNKGMVAYAPATTIVDKIRNAMKNRRVQNMAPIARQTTERFAVPIATGSIVRSNQPKVTRVRNREFIQDIASGTFANFSGVIDAPINPGNSLMFPKLSLIADAFEKFSFKRLKFTYQPNCPSTTTGTVAMYADYDPVDTAVSNMAQLMEHGDAVEGSVWHQIELNIHPRKLNAMKWYYVQNQLTNTASAVDRQQNQLDFRLFVDKIPTNTELGSLVVEYDVELIAGKAVQPISFTASPAGVVTTTDTAGYVQLPMTPRIIKGVTPCTNYYANQDPTHPTMPTQWGTWYAINVQPSAGYRVSMALNITTTSLFKYEIGVNVITLDGTYYPSILATVDGTGSALVIAGTATNTHSSRTIGLSPYIRVYAIGTTTPAAGATVIVNTSSSNVFSYQPTTLQNVGARQAYHKTAECEAKATGEPTRVFVLPRQLDEAQEYLATIDGEVYVSTLPQEVKELSLEDVVEKLSRLELEMKENSVVDVQSAKMPYYQEIARPGTSTPMPKR